MYLRQPKVFRLGPEMIVGACGDARWADEWRRIEPLPSGRVPAEIYLRECLIPLVQAGAKSARGSNGEALIGFRGRLFVVDTSFAVSALLHNFWAIGSGDLVARGALFATVGKPPRKRAVVALEAAKALVAFIDGPWGFVMLKR